MDSAPKVSPITGKSVIINGVLEIVGHLAFNCLCFVTLENELF